ncbi:putative ATP-dependent RNA helicase SCDLUD_003659 [Saccharomycodes ludwigii]|uniref:putative ATP-dependent RNA helicase n=1 Tax=Saccharomycodes ludwigii TaxID=36035 RepID=UPI001E85B6D9|nr:hypothetical protein SCDLUD_003659 [Saccharomycodes ludwigii]KAH3900662.1 hypothetical protein SCDLUD_003659 [Saccharomycodes ludwigii]
MNSINDDDTDDMMLMNFSTSLPPTDTTKNTISKSKITGGSWKDRRRLQNMLNGKTNNDKKRTTAIKNINDKSNDKSIKTSKSESTVQNKGAQRETLEESINNKESLDHKVTKSRPPQQTDYNLNKQIVSSLFTSNKSIFTTTNNNERSGEKANPSNAPLLSEQNTFESLGIDNPILLKNLKDRLKVTKPTKIQKLAIPKILSKNDLKKQQKTHENGTKKKNLFIHAQTGSGKTLSFLLPLLNTILSLNEDADGNTGSSKLNRNSGCFALIITPTRELASQIYTVLNTITVHYLVPCLLIGGEKKKSEKARLRKGVNFIIGTPGRILDHLTNTRSLKNNQLASLKYCILDEGDKLMELGFEDTLKQIFEIINQEVTNINYQMILCSATKSDNVGKLGDELLKSYYTVSSSSSDNNTGLNLDANTVPDQLLQKIVIVPSKLRLVTLAGCLSNITMQNMKEKANKKVLRTIVFLSCADSVDFHYDVFAHGSTRIKEILNDTVVSTTNGNTILPSFLKQQKQQEKEEEEEKEQNKKQEEKGKEGESSNKYRTNYVFHKLHGSLSQQVRTATLKHFCSDKGQEGKHLILFCTDVASRGLDLPHVSTVIELDPPFAVEDHLHRIGRTARAGIGGESILFLLPGEEEGYMDYIKPFHPKGWKLMKYDKDVLQMAFSNIDVARGDKRRISNLENKKSFESAWDSNATTWHLNVERRVLEDSKFKNLAINGFTSHVRAYATHISKEKQFFNVKFLHLGHLCKSFGLRERPKNLGMMYSNNGNKRSKDGNEDSSKRRKKEDSRSKMLRLAKLAVKQSSDEFNY